MISLGMMLSPPPNCKHSCRYGTYIIIPFPFLVSWSNLTYRFLFRALSKYPKQRKLHFSQTKFLIHFNMKHLSANHPFQEAKGKLATKHYTDGGDEPGAKRKAGAKAEPLLSLPSHFRPADLSKTVKVLYCTVLCTHGFHF